MRVKLKKESGKKNAKRHKNHVKIDYWDLWSFDGTLAQIIYPGLVALKKVKHGVPTCLEDEDIPEHLKYDYDHFIPYPDNIEDSKKRDAEFQKVVKAWNWILDEMIWAFKQYKDDTADGWHFMRVDNLEWLKNGSKGKKFITDEEGLKKHTERVKNGLRLFGKYYGCLWD